MTLRLDKQPGALDVAFGGQPLLRYVYQPDDPQLESPRPYLYPLHTLGGDPVSLFRPHDHVWHRGIAFSLPNVGPANFWGGVTYTRAQGYVQLPNNGSQRHHVFTRLDAQADAVGVTERLHWLTEPGETWFREQRRLGVTVAADQGAWTLTFGTELTNVSDREIVIGSPTTEGRDNAGYGGLFWRGPRSFTGGRVYCGDREGGDELMGVRAPWMGFTGRHDGHGHWSTLVFVDAEDNPDHPVQWFVRSEPFACLCPAPFFATEVPVAPGATVSLRYAVVIADGDPGLTGAADLAALGHAALKAPEDD